MANMDEIERLLGGIRERLAEAYDCGRGGLWLPIVQDLADAVRLLAARPASGSEGEEVPRGWHVRSWANQHGDLIVNFGDGLFTWRRAKWETLEAAARAADAARGERT